MWWSFAQQRWTFRLEGSFMSPCGPRESSTCRVLPSKTKTWWGPSEWLWPKATALTIKLNTSRFIHAYSFLSSWCLHKTLTSQINPAKKKTKLGHLHFKATPKLELIINTVSTSSPEVTAVITIWVIFSRVCPLASDITAALSRGEKEPGCLISPSPCLLLSHS